MRSSVVPHTMASETAQKTNWKNHFASTVASDRHMTGKACCGSPKSRRKKPLVPMMWPSPPPKANAKPTAQYMIPAIEKLVTILAMTVPAFLPREKPISRNAKPACMNMTRQPATITQVELMPTVSGSLPAPAASNVSASAEAGSTSAASTASALMRTALLLATAPRDRLFMGVLPPVEARLSAHGDQRHGDGKRAPAKGLYPCVENLGRAIRQLVERRSTERSGARPARRPGPAAARAGPRGARRGGSGGPGRAGGATAS